MKERTIESLRAGEVEQAGGAMDNRQLAVQLEEAANERDMLKEDLQQLNVQLYNTKMELQVFDCHSLHSQHCVTNRTLKRN